LKIKQTILILVLFGLNFELFAQDFEFKLYYKDPCNEQTEYTPNYFLEKDGVKFHPNFDGIINLKSKGKYNLVHEKEIIPIRINKKENSHTIILSDKQEFIVTHDKYGYVFRNCESKLSGNIVDYFENGKVRMIGRFKNGLAIGYLTEFYPNGELKEIRLFDKKGNLIERIVTNE
jgi:antitoxin component YwqK of YwqJK toxin-antitoxin module